VKALTHPTETTWETPIDGKRGRLEELYLRHGPQALRLAYLLTGSRDAAQDLVQDAFVRIAARFHDIRDPDAFGAYLSRSVVNLANSRFRRQKVERSYLARAESPRPGDLPDIPTRHDLRKVLFTLPSRQRAAIVLRYYIDLSEDQTAEVLGCSVGAVKSLVLRGMQTLRRQVRRDAP
jgi:RNA polymerase sigma-70 factor (sigma-E family)